MGPHSPRDSVRLSVNLPSKNTTKMSKGRQENLDWLKSSVEKLSKQQVAEFREAFDLFDDQRQGYITTKSLKDAMTSLGQDPTDTEIKAMIAKVDIDGNGKLDWEEFLVMMAAKTLSEKSDAGTWAHRVPIPYVWDKSFATLYKRIDDEHRNLFHAIWDCFDHREDWYKLLHMVATMQQHFTYEEGAMYASKHDGYARHKEVHDSYMTRLKTFSVPVKDRDIKYCMSWLVNHIKNTDFKYKGKLLFNNEGDLLAA